MFDTIATLIDGASKLAPGPLRPDELQQLQRLLQPGETVEAHVRGRAERRGWTVWTVTPQRVLCVDLKGRAPRAHAHSAVAAVKAIRGKWGATLRLEVAGTVESFFAADPQLGDSFVAVLLRYCPHLESPQKLVRPPEPPPPPKPLPGVPANFKVQGAAPPQADAERLLDSLREAAALREKNLLTEEEYSALKRRLLGA